MTGMIHHADLEPSSALDQMERKDLGIRVLGEKMRGRAQAGELSTVGMKELVERRESDLNIVGSKEND